MSLTNTEMCIGTRTFSVWLSNPRSIPKSLATFSYSSQSKWLCKHLEVQTQPHSDVQDPKEAYFPFGHSTLDCHRFLQNMQHVKLVKRTLMLSHVFAPKHKNAQRVKHQAKHCRFFSSLCLLEQIKLRREEWAEEEGDVDYLRRVESPTFCLREVLQKISYHTPSNVLERNNAHHISFYFSVL